MGNFLTICFLVLAILGTYFVTANPLEERKSFPKYSDTVVGVLCMTISLVYFMVIFLLPEYFSDDSETLPCGRRSLQAQCYSIDEASCRQAWSSFQAECEQAALPTREKRPAAILSPIIYRCQAKKFDRILSYNRKNEDSSKCEEYFDGLRE